MATDSDSDCGLRGGGHRHRGRHHGRAHQRSDHSPSRATSPPSAPPQFSVLREPATSVLNRPNSSATTLPNRLRTNAAMRYADVDVASARLAQRTPTRDYYVARAQQGKAICLIDAVPTPVSATYRPGNPGGVTCRYTNGHTQSFAQGFVTGFLAVQIPSSPTTWVIAGVVPNGFARVRAGAVSAPVINNTFVLTGAKPWLAITATGPAGVSYRVARIATAATRPRSREAAFGVALHAAASAAGEPATICAQLAAHAACGPACAGWPATSTARTTGC